MIQPQRQLRESIQIERTPPYRIITTDMITEMFAEKNMGTNTVEHTLHVSGHKEKLSKWMGADGVYIVDQAMMNFIEQFGLNYKW